MPRKRVFSYDEARALLPDVRQRTREAVEELEALGGDADEAPDEEADERILLAWAADVMAQGIEVKGRWLVDFDSGAGYWCWKWPEEDLSYFHGYEEGFGGRVRIQ